MVTENISGPIDCACVIHGNGYTWDYVDKLYSMLSRHISKEIRMHVYTEADRAVPAPYIKHTLFDWGFSGPRRSWWYKIQLFNSEHHKGPLLYFDLDTVIVGNLDWIFKLPQNYFWTVHDFKHLWKHSDRTINSSVMWFHTQQYHYIWEDFISQDLKKTILKYRGDQDYITSIITDEKLRFFDQNRVKSWRWQCLDGGYNFDKKQHNKPGLGTQIPDLASILVFHGNPKPDQITDPLVVQYWQ